MPFQKGGIAMSDISIRHFAFLSIQRLVELCCLDGQLVAEELFLLECIASTFIKCI